MEWVKEARKNLQAIMSRLPGNFLSVTRETAIDVLCDELRKIPVPIVSTLLSNTVNKALRPKSGGHSIQYVLDTMQHMQQSDDEFLHGLSAIGEDIDRLDTLVQAVLREIRDPREKLTVPKPIISQPDYQPNYPVSDNELRFGLMNIGGGAITVPEIELITERWEPETKVDYTVPAAPLAVLRLKVELSPRKAFYQLLKLNDEPHRRFGAYSEGAEDIWIQMSSETNARYLVRINIPYKDMSTGTDGKLVYPPPGESPLDVRFAYAPGWDIKVTPENMLVRERILSDIITTFTEVTAVLENAEPTDDFEQRDIIDRKVREAGFPMGIYPGILMPFARPITQMAQLERRPGVLSLILKLAHQFMRYTPGNLPFEHLEVEEMVNTTDTPEIGNKIRQFITESNGPKRQQLLDGILTTL